MATLEKIRNRSLLLFTIIIVALLAFILGDFFNSSRTLFGPGTAAAEVAGEKIDIHEFNRRVEEQHQSMQAQGYTAIDNARLQSSVMSQMIYETLMKKEFDNLGITVTDKELSMAMSGETTLPMVTQLINQYGFQRPEEFYEMAFNSAKYQIPQEQAVQLQQAWQELENNVVEQLKAYKFQSLFAGALVANKLDAKALFEENSTVSTIEYAKVDFSTLNDDDFKPTDEEIAAKYNDNKNRYRLNEETRKVDYILVDIVPSEEDLNKAYAEVQEGLNILNSQEGCEGLSGNFVVNNVTNPKKAMRSEALKNMLDTMAVGKATQLSFANNTYTLIKLLGVNANQQDTIKFDFATVAVKDVAQRDSILNVLNAGGKFEDVKAENVQRDNKVCLLDQGAEQLKEIFEGAVDGKYFTPDTAANATAIRLVKLNGYTTPVTTYNLAEITYTVDASTTTINNLNAKLRDFLAKNNTAEKFSEEAVKAGYNVFPAEVTPSSLSVANIENTRNAAKWVLGAKVGEVSDIFDDEQGGKLLAVALKADYKDFTPASDPALNEYLKTQVVNDKKASKLIADFKGKGKTIAEYAGAMNSSIDTAEVAFGQRAISGFGMNESELAAEVANAKQGSLVGPIQTNNSVVVFQVDNVAKAGREFDFNSDAANFNRQFGGNVLGRNLYLLLLGNKKVKYNLLNFYQD